MLNFQKYVQHFRQLIASLSPLAPPARHNHRLIAEHPTRVRVPGKPQPAGTKIARQAAAHAIGMRGRVRVKP